MMAFVVNVLCDFNYLLAALLNFLFCVLFLTLDTNKVLYFKFLVYAFVLAAFWCADCCDGSDEYDGKVKCPNTCWEAGKVARDKLKKKIATYQEGVLLRKKEIEQAKQNLVKDEAELSNLKNEEKILKGLVQQLKGMFLICIVLSPVNISIFQLYSVMIFFFKVSSTSYIVYSLYFNMRYLTAN